MNWKAICFGLMVAAVAAVSSMNATAYSTVYPTEYGQHRIGAYSSTFPYEQGMYNYIAPPTALTRYGADYHISNIRSAVYPQYPFTLNVNLHRPYFGYPYGTDRVPARVGLSSFGAWRY